MILIAHRGNTNGPNPEDENSPAYVLKALDLGYHVEIDVWLKSSGLLYLGHDYPKYETTLSFLQHDDRIICHAKTVETLSYLVNNNLHCFFHDIDKAILTSHNKIWLYPGVFPINCNQGIIVMPEWPSLEMNKDQTDNNIWLDFVVQHNNLYYGVCSDYVKLIKDKME